MARYGIARLVGLPTDADAVTMVADRIADQSDAQSGQYSIRELERTRDDNLVAILLALEANNWGAGEVLGQHRARLTEEI